MTECRICVARTSGFSKEKLLSLLVFSFVKLINILIKKTLYEPVLIILFCFGQ
jgi:hypothetical protein